MLLAGNQYTAVGTPFITTAVATMDVETYSEAGYCWDHVNERWVGLQGAEKKRGLEVVGAKVYVNHPSFEIRTLSYDLLDGRGMRRWRPRWCDVGLADEPHDLIAHVAAGKPIEGWNSGGFEWLVWNDYCVKKFGWPMMKLEALRDAMAKARAFSMPGGLDNFGKVAGLTNKKLASGKALINKFCVPRQPTARDPRTRILMDDEPIEALELQKYCDGDVLSEIEAGLRTPDLTPEELEVWQVDQLINQRGLQVDVEAVENCIAIVLQAHEKYNAELSTLTNGAVQAASELPALKDWLATRGLHLPNAQEDTITGELERLKKLGVPETDPCRRALEIRVILGSASVKKTFAFRNQQYGGRLYNLYSYYAARTGRWTGNGPQPQNLPRGGMFSNIDEVEKALGVIASRCLELVEFTYGDALEVIGNLLRNLIIAAPGHDLICSDFSAIEGVGTAALAGEEWRLEVFRTHGKIYEVGASKITGVPFEEFMRYRKENKKHHPLRQTVGKVSELASGYGGWIGAWKRFGADEFMSDFEIKNAILAWRRESPMIVEFWGGQTRDKFTPRCRPDLYGLEGNAIAAVKYPGQCHGYRGIEFQMHGDVLYCKLPSGRTMAYHHPRLQKSVRDYAEPWELDLSYEGWNNNPQMGPIGWIRMSIYGGKWTENIVQAACRDLQAKALVRIERANYRPVLHSHDEIAGEVAHGWGTIQEFEALMAERPWWAKDWPIKVAGGFRGPRYGKFEDPEDAVRKAA